MNKPTPKQMRQLAKRPAEASYGVGYGKPPVDTRFKPGTSGNPKGRPKGKRRPSGPEAAARQHERLKAIILEESYRVIKVNDGAGQVTVPMAQAVMRSLAVTAAKGNTRAQKLFSELLANTEAANKRLEDENMEAMLTYKSNWDAELERRALHGIKSLPDPLPHPDDIIVDYHRDTVTIHGPMDKRQLAELDLWLTRKNDNEAELEYLLEYKTHPANAKYLDFIDREIATTRRILEIIDLALSHSATPQGIQRRLGQLNLKPPAYLNRRQSSDDTPE